ncbi:MAG: YciI family protein [Bacteroidota bacterium]
MKHIITIFLFTFISHTMSAQETSTFIYEIKLLEKYRHVSSWTEREHKIQQQHLAYLDSLTKTGKLTMAGIIDQGLEEHTGFIILKTTDYQEAYSISQEDPSIKQGMMTARLRLINIYFKN